MLARRARSGIKFNQPEPTARILLYAGELTSLLPTCQRVRVMEGTAYMTQGRADIIVGCGESWGINKNATFDVTGGKSGDKVLVSALRNKPLVLELFQ